MPLAPYRTGGNFKLFLALFFIVWSIRATVGTYVDDQLPPDSGALKLYELVSQLILWTAPAVLYALAIRSDRPMQSMRLGWPDFSQRGWLPWTLGLGTLLLVAWDITNRNDATFGDFGVELVDQGMGVMLWALPTACVEEAFFRGLVLTELSERLRFWVANLIAALLFAAIHLPGWLYADDINIGLVTRFAGMFFVGLFTGLLTRQTRSIWPAVVWHAATMTIVGVW